MLTIPEKKSVLFLADILIVLVLAGAALGLTAVFSPYAGEQLFPQGISMLLLGSLLLGVGYLNEMLDIESLRSDGTFLRKWVQAWAIGVGLFATGYLLFAVPWGAEEALGIKITRFAPLIFAVLLLILLPVGRFAVASWLGFEHSHRKCVLVGAGKSAREFISLNKARNGDWDIAGVVDDDPQKLGHSVDGHEVIATLPDLPELVSKQCISDIILAINSPLEKRSLDGVMRCFEKGAEILPVAQAIERTYGRVPIHSLGDKWLPSTFWSSTDSPLIQRVVKRGADLLAAVLILVPLIPVALPVLLFSLIFQGWPLFYRQQRVGQGGQIFTLTKLRSMRRDAEKNGAQWADKNDSRITPFGRFLRLTRLDEVPQLWNVFKGDMSLVGPRPERPEFVEVLEEKIPFYRARLAAKPGLTGWAQIKLGYTNDVDDAKTKLEYDLYYIKNRSIWLDVVILLQTIRVVLARKGQ
jgi:exopolysaccharide biosynthesis polyprenyl glycosylphosphotransferase